MNLFAQEKLLILKPRSNRKSRPVVFSIYRLRGSPRFVKEKETWSSSGWRSRGWRRRRLDGAELAPSPAFSQGPLRHPEGYMEKNWKIRLNYDFYLK